MSWNPKYIILLFLSTLVSYLTAIKIHHSKPKRRKKLFLYLGLFFNFGILFFFKYFNFFSESIWAVLRSISIPLDPITVKILLPVGISFYIFQAVSYILDVYWGKMKPQKHFGVFALYISFFPQLVAGPIERAGNLLPQFLAEHYFDYKKAVDGLKLMMWGFFKKIVIADALAVVVGVVYDNPTNYTGIALILATFFFAFQIYCDFSGYSDIAIGCAQVMGFKLMDNFRRPYFSRSVSEFWKRWHISLSSWFKDYLYIPLGGNRVSVPRWYLNLFIVFVVSGLWHGANWTFVVWGAIHGSYLICGEITKPIRKKTPDFLKISRDAFFIKLLNIFVTFILVCIAWIFFRANSLSDAFYILTHLFSGLTLNPKLGMGLGGMRGLVYLLSLIGFMEFIHLIQEHRSIRAFLDTRPLYFRWTIYIVILILILLFGVFEEVKFIYFQF